MKAGSFEREIRLAVLGGVLFLLFLAALSLVVLRNVAAWGVGESEAAAAARARVVVERLQTAGDPVLALSGSAGVARLLRDEAVRAAALYDSEGNRLVEAGFLPDAGISPPTLKAAERPRGATPVVKGERTLSPPGVTVSVAFAGGRRILRLLYDSSSLAAAERNVRLVSWIVPLSAVVLVALVFPFFRRLMRPIDALKETARDAGLVVPPLPPPAGPARRDEAEQAVQTFQRTIEELRLRTSELEDLRRREEERADSLAIRAESLVLSTTRLERELSSQRELARLGEMSAGIAHEFRNATATILGYARLASQAGDETARARHLAAISAEAEHVARVTGDFLFFARPERLDLSETELGPLAEEIAAEQRGLTPALSVSAEGEFGPATIDAALLRRALVNLVRNACEAAASRVVIRGEGVVGGAVRLAVEDDGPGIPPDVLPKLFTPFFSTKESGTGLGLALVAKIAVLHGSEVSVGRSASLGGARFVLSIPRTPPAAGAA